MKQLSILFGTALSGLILTAAGQVRADYLNWTYTTSSNVSGVSVNSLSPNGGATVSLTSFTNPQPGGTLIPVEAYVTSASAPANFGPTTNQPSTFSLALKITDGNGASGTLNFTGSLAGELTPTSSSVVASFTPTTSNSIIFDGHTYTATIFPQTLVPPNDGPMQHYIMASIAVTNASGSGGTPPPTGGGGGVNSTPEPTSLLLSSLGFSCLGFRCWWKRRQLTRTLAAA